MNENDENIQPQSKFRPSLLVGGGSIVLLAILILLLTQNPGRGGPLIVLILLSLMFLFVFLMSAAVLQFMSRLLTKMALSSVRTLYTSVAVAAGAVFLVGLQTLNQLQLIDIALVIVFELLLNFYLLRRF